MCKRDGERLTCMVCKRDGEWLTCVVCKRDGECLHAWCVREVVGVIYMHGV